MSPREGLGVASKSSGVVLGSGLGSWHEAELAQLGVLVITGCGGGHLCPAAIRHPQRIRTPKENRREMLETVKVVQGFQGHRGCHHFLCILKTIYSTGIRI